MRFPFVNHGCITSNKELYGTFCPDVGVPGLLLNLNEVTVRILRDCARLGCRSILPFKIENLILDGYSRTAYSLYYDDHRYRLETTFKGILAAAALPDLFVKDGLVERRYRLNGEYLAKDEVDSIELNEDGEMVTITFFHSADTSYGLTNPLRVNVNIE